MIETKGFQFRELHIKLDLCEIYFWRENQRVDFAKTAS